VGSILAIIVSKYKKIIFKKNKNPNNPPKKNKKETSIQIDPNGNVKGSVSVDIIKNS